MDLSKKASDLRIVKMVHTPEGLGDNETIVYFSDGVKAFTDKRDVEFEPEVEDFNPYLDAMADIDQAVQPEPMTPEELAEWGGLYGDVDFDDGDDDDTVY